MKFSTAFVAAAAAHSAAAGVVATGALSNQEIVETILENPHLLTPYSYKTLEAKTRNVLNKRQAPKAGKGFDPSALLQALAGQSRSNSTAPVSTVPEVQEQKAKAWDGAKRVKIRYGPYRIPPISEKNLESELLNVQGMVNTFKIGAKKPCAGECTVLALQGDIEFADGKTATNADGAWFHHAVLLNSGPKVLDGNCGTSKVDNMFMSGNERSVNGYALPNAKIKSGYSIHPEDNFILTTELMNLKDKEQWVWLTISYEFLEGHQPDYKQGRMLWMSIGVPLTCPGNNIKSPWGPTNLTLAQQPKSEQFSEHSFPWKAPRDGWILAPGGHMHDGGVSLEIFQNEKRICNSVPKYTKGDGHSHGMGGMNERRQISGGSASNNDIDHIETQGGCNFLEGVPLKKGDTMHLQANYDFKKYPGMKNKKGELDEVMGIVGSIVAF